MPLTGGSGRLIGTWRLISIQFELADIGERFDLYGPHPLGFLILTDGARLMGMVTSADREPPRDEADGAALFESMMAYSGKYRVEGEDKFITSVDLARHPAWNGTEQTRFFKLDNGMLSITTAPADSPAISRPTGSWHPDLAKRMSWAPALPWRRERGKPRTTAC